MSSTICPGNYLTFLDCLAQAHTRFGIEVQAYCLMGNHYHLLIKTPRGNLGRAMRHINGVYTQHHNQLKKTDVPLFRGRYKAINIDAASYLTQVSRYIHRNPVDMKKPLVEVLLDHPWSSYPAYLNKMACPDCSIDKSYMENSIVSARHIVTAPEWSWGSDGLGGQVYCFTILFQFFSALF